jgi:hypothetical protein
LLDSCEAQPFRGILYRCGGVRAPGDFEDGGVGRGVRRRALDEALRSPVAEHGVIMERGTVVRGRGSRRM